MCWWGQTLEVIAHEPGSSSEGAQVWAKSADQGNSWHSASVAVLTPIVLFKYTMPSSGGYRGDAAIDDVSAATHA